MDCDRNICYRVFGEHSIGHPLVVRIGTVKRKFPEMMSDLKLEIQIEVNEVIMWDLVGDGKVV